MIYLLYIPIPPKPGNNTRVCVMVATRLISSEEAQKKKKKKLATNALGEEVWCWCCCQMNEWKEEERYYVQ
jgi:hypothetical protein